MCSLVSYLKHLVLHQCCKQKKYAVTQQIAPMSVLQCQEQFIEDICDGDRRKANALIAEKLIAQEGLSYSEAVRLVYLEVLAIATDQQV